MTTLSTFLRERLGEDIDSAREARRARIVAIDPPGITFLQRLGPDHVIADVTAKMAVLASYVEHAEYDDEDNSFEHATGRIVGLGEAVRLLASVYAGHPDYRREWRPS